jgi:hypothetical protein
MKTLSFCDDEQGPQTVVIASRSHFALPLLKKFLMPACHHPSDPDSPLDTALTRENNCLPDFELLGLKYVDRLEPWQTRILTPFDVGDPRWQESIDVLDQVYEEDNDHAFIQGWMLCVLRRRNARALISQIVCK